MPLAPLTRDGPLGVVLLAIAVGAVCGAWLRWGLSYWLNPRLAHLPLGTLAANLVGGYLIGVAVAVFAAHPAISPAWRLVLITGFLGSLTTFSTFSSESVALMQGGAYGPALLHAGLHLFGSIAATFAGIATVRLVAA
ncbi:MAG: fluoride efflux transporter CrcB [Burkholderiaceae bacterium]|nr:fluoride efflux transporter CrcB [Burkholderiaceae bacterium]